MASHSNKLTIQLLSPESVQAIARVFGKPKPSKKFVQPSNMICRVRFGSHLYGTQTPSSDEDWKGVFMPSVESIALGRIPRTYSESTAAQDVKNQAGDLDVEYYSLHHFLHLAVQGQTVAIDMLFAPDNMTTLDPKWGHIWIYLRENRKRFLSKNMGAFIGYARGQAAKYSLKGERLNKLKDFVSVLEGIPTTLGPDGWDRNSTLQSVWDKLPKDDERINPHGLRELQIASKWYGETTDILVVLESASKLLDRYGNRAKIAADADGADYKALSHAVRVSKELIEILTFGQVDFPLRDAPLLLDIKQGRLSLEEVENILDRDLAFIEVQMAQTLLPDQVDRQWWDEQLIRIVLDYVKS